MIRPHDPTTERLQGARDFMMAEYGGGFTLMLQAFGVLCALVIVGAFVFPADRAPNPALQPAE